ncbi:MAG: hypothetical protein V7752_19730 [Halopseudomonas sp.]
MRLESKGKCRCGKITFAIALPKELENYSPRKCDCDFCMKRNASYLSHPDGCLFIESLAPLTINKHGSDQASFLSCSGCNSLVSVVYQFPAGLKGALNATLLSESERLKTPVGVSPKLLDPKEKISRWESVWLNVRVNGNDHI